MPRAFVVFVALFLLAPEASAQLSGVYTVGGTAPDYATLAAAFADLEASGVSGPVQLRVRYGTYAGALSLGPVAGTSSANSIWIRGLADSGTGDLPVLQHTPAAVGDWVFTLDAEYVLLDGLRIEVTNPFQPNGNVLRVGSDLVEVRDCEIESVWQGNASSGATALRVAGSNALIVSNTIEGGTRGIHVGGAVTGENTRIRLNTVTADSLGILVENQSDSGAGDLVVRANVVSSTLQSYGFAGIRVSDVSGGAEVSRNQVQARRGLGIDLIDVIGSGAEPTDLTNNMVAVIDGAHPALRIQDSDYVGAFHNSLYAFAAFASGVDVVSGFNVRLRNNLIRAYNANAYAIEVFDPSALDLSDTNAFGADISGSEFRGRWNGTTHTTLAQYQAASGTEAASVIVPMEFVNSGSADLHLDGPSVGDRDLRAPPLATVSIDIDGDVRDAAHPYYGADEAAESLADPAPMNGLYLVRTDGLGDYDSFDDLLNDLVYAGVSGPVQFSVINNVYTEQVTIPPIAGVSATNTITFLGLPVGSVHPSIRHAPEAGANWVLRIESDWVTFIDHEINNTGTSASEGRAVVITGDDVTLDRAILLAHDAQTTTTTLESEASGVFLDGAEGATVIDSEIPRASVGIYGVVGLSARGPVLTGNTIAEPYTHAVWLQGGVDAVVSDNLIQHASGSDAAGQSVAMVLDGFQGAYRIERNEITVYGMEGILLTNATSSDGSDGRIANNLIATIDDSSNRVPLALQGSEYVQVYHNTLYKRSTGAALEIDDASSSASSGIQIHNNIGDGGAYAFDIEDIAAVSSMDYNTWWGGSTPYAAGATTYATLEAFTAATGFGANSHEADPDYVELPFMIPSGDLRLDPAQGGAFAFTGTPLATVPEDIDGDTRSVTFPYTGADELSTPIRPLAGFIEITPTGGGDYETIADFLADLNQRGMDGAVTVEIASGYTYTDPIDLADVPGLDAASPLTIRGPVSGLRPLLQGAEPMLVLNSVEAVSIERIAFEQTSTGNVGIVTETSDVVIEGCTFDAPFSNLLLNAQTNSLQAPNIRLTVRDNLFRNGARGLQMGMIQVAGSRATAGHVISGNSFEDQSTAAIEIDRVMVSITGNSIEATSSPSTWVGIDVDHFTSSMPLSVQADMIVEGNTIHADGGTGVYWSWSQSDPPEAGDLRIVNNAIRMAGTGATLGLDVSVPQEVLVAHNTVAVASPDTSSAALELAFLFGNPGSATVRNNIFQATQGRAMTFPSASGVLTSDWNVLASGGPSVAEWWGTYCPDVACFQAASGTDPFSTEYAPAFVDEPGGDLHLTPASAGDAALAVAAHPDVTDDIDGDARPGPGAYAGADEITGSPISPPRTDIPLFGTFTVDASGGDFADLYEAIDRLYLVGLGGHAVFEIAGGTYTGRIDTSKPFPGASADSTVTFRSAPGEMAVLEWNAWADYLDAVWEMEGVSYVTLDSLTIRALGTSYTRGVWVYPRSFGIFDDLPTGVTFRDMRFEAPNFSSVGNYSRGIHAEATKGLRVETSTFVDARVHVERYTTQTQHYPEDTVVSGNTFSLKRLASPSSAISVTGAEGLSVTNNHIDRVPASGSCIATRESLYILARSGDVAIERNTILAPEAGLYLRRDFDAGAGVLNLIRVVNNTMWQPPGACGPVLEIDVPNVLVAHNALYGESDKAVVDIQNEATAGIDLRHNLMVSTSGHALITDGAAVLTETSPNALWTDGALFARWGGIDVADLAALQAQSGGFATSIETLPTFADEASGDLRLTTFDGDLVVTPLASVPEDIDGALRTDPTLMGVSHLTIPNLAVGVRALLQGAYPTAPTNDGTPDLMRTALVSAGAVPLNHPYDDAAFDGKPAECDAAGVVAPGALTADVVDWVVVALRTDPAGPDLACQPALLREDGVVLGLSGTPGLVFAAMASGDYHVVVYHRTHLAVMSAAPEALSEVSANVDLAGAGHYGGGAFFVEPGLRALRAGDGDGDGSILAPDQQSVWLPTVGQAGYVPGDFNLDGSVLANDQQVFWLPNVGVQSAVPGASSLTAGEPETAPEARDIPALRENR